jgi:Tol biopolymer transport system component
VFGSRRNSKWGIYQKLSNGTGSEELLFESDLEMVPISWSGTNTVLFYVRDPKSGTDVWALPLAGDRKPVALLQTPFNEQHPQISPDGKWFAYTSNETGRSEIYVQTLPPGGGKWQVSSTGGTFARWRPDGKELFYMERASFGKIVAVAVQATGTTFEFSAPRPLFDSGYLNVSPGHTGNYNTFDVSADGTRFLIPRPEVSILTDTPLTVVLNRTAALRRK